MPCRCFKAGNCNNGDKCRFGHDEKPKPNSNKDKSKREREGGFSLGPGRCPQAANDEVMSDEYHDACVAADDAARKVTFGRTKVIIFHDSVGKLYSAPPPPISDN